MKISTVLALVFSSLMIASCATTPESPPGAAQVRNTLTTLQNDPNLADRARVELREAEAAVREAEQPVSRTDAALGEHRVYMAEQKVAIAQARATARYAEDQRERLSEERDAARLAARTREVGRARDDAESARSSAAQQSTEYQRQIDELQAEVTDRGLVLTLGDVLFATGSAELQDGTNRNLDRLVSFLNEHPERRIQIEGHTDSVGSAAFNQTLSLQRAQSVRDYLTQQGIASRRISTSGIGMEQPVASNDTTAGRQQNRRVEIIIDNPN
ncbi:OmpA family protein [Marinimicrobium alkaliphilum]|uniref:OmpA family protein n=1 Tax=Marinimicrobium alkaliphilum TaxID=2202654 RepID=UPI000DBA9830|nr:OmpA family protein [Marinimicrobium alkaliphilum]